VDLEETKENTMRKKDELTKERTCMQSAHPNEMTFVLLSRDAAAPVAIRAWIEERIRLGKNERDDPQIIEAFECAATMEAEGRKWVSAATHYPPGMGEESRRLHREYNALVAAQRAGAKNGAEVVRLTDECAAKGIILVPGGENL
jgi:deoxycytidylate deaminase